ncbi:MAG: RtcB family protein [Deinococcales bacterium]
MVQSGQSYGARFCSVLQIWGGQAAQLRFIELINFCYAYEKRLAAAKVASLVWQVNSFTHKRDRAKEEARAPHQAGQPYKQIISQLSQAYELSEGFIYHAIYDKRGTSRRLSGIATEAETSGEIVWVKLKDIDSFGQSEVFDIVTGDSAQSFFANGVLVHNCGNCAILSDRRVEGLEQTDLITLANTIAEHISFGVGRKNKNDDAPTDDPLFEDPAWEVIPTKKGVRERMLNKARSQLGTVGSGNHYVDIFADEKGRIWIGVHFGSRGFGHGIASSFMALAKGGHWEDKGKESEALLSLDDELGKDYWALMQLAGRYAYVGREWVARKTLSLLGAKEVELVHNHHNYAWQEEHGGETYTVVRKGATPAFPGQKGFVGGSMGDNAVILQGSTDPNIQVRQEAAMYSTVHGAGRVMSRTQAAGKWDFKRKVRKTEGRISESMMQDWLKEKSVILRGGGLDEAPQAYRRLDEVLAVQGSTVEILHQLKPLIVVMAGANEYDPYKD